MFDLNGRPVPRSAWLFVVGEIASASADDAGRHTSEVPQKQRPSASNRRTRRQLLCLPCDLEEAIDDRCNPRSMSTRGIRAASRNRVPPPIAHKNLSHGAIPWQVTTLCVVAAARACPTGRLVRKALPAAQPDQDVLHHFGHWKLSWISLAMTPSECRE